MLIIFHSYDTYAHLSSLPNPLNSLRDSNVIRFKLVKSDQHKHRANVQRPPTELPRARNSPGWEVVDNAGLEADVGVCDEQGAEHAVKDWVEGAGSEWHNRQRNDGRGDQSGRTVSIPFRRVGKNREGRTNLSAVQW